VKKAGTIILAFSILLWVMMTFPGPSKEEAESFEVRRNNLTQSLLATPDMKEWGLDQRAIKELNSLSESKPWAEGGNGEDSFLESEGSSLFELARVVSLLRDGKAQREIHSKHMRAATKYLEFRDRMIEVDIQEQQAALKHTIAGWIGHRLETITWPLGFDYRTNVALVGGFAAKEVVVSTLGTAYSLGEVDTDEAGSLSERLRNDPNWNPLLAITLLIFTMLYVPCFVTVISIGRESSWVWAGFSVAFNLVVAYTVALVVRLAGAALSLGY
jgi:ferrous iron transport protein B